MKRLLFAASLLAATSPAAASLNLFKSFVGNYGLSTDGGGSNVGDYTVSATVPLGATVAAAYLYQATYSVGAPQPISLNGTPVTFGSFVPNATACCGIASSRADVTSAVKTVIDGGSGGTYNFNISEGSSGVTDGTALVVVYSFASLPVSTVAILDGFASVTGDTTNINFAEPLNPEAPGFVADVRLGIGFSCCGQKSTINVNGDLLTENAGNYNDGNNASDGELITVGSDDDPFSPALPTYEQDTERYNLKPFINAGDTTIKIDTINASADDNIFLLAGLFTGRAGINEPPPPVDGVPEPASWAMMIAGFALIGRSMRRRTAMSVSYA
jgi:hypothetical protein